MEPGRTPSELRKLLRDLLKPAQVKKIKFTSFTGDTARGFLVTFCPIEKRESGKDFEIKMEEIDPHSIRYVVVDGRRIFPGGTRTGLEKGSDRPSAPIRSQHHMALQ